MIRFLIPIGMLALLRDRRANVLMLTAFSLVPVTFATGMAIDYSKASRLQTKLNAAADAGALAAVTTPMMAKTKLDAALAAANMFQSQATNLPGLNFSPTSTPVTAVTADKVTLDYGAFRVVVSETNNSGTIRVSEVFFDATSTNAFGGVLDMETLPIGGHARTTARVAPNIDFYLALDISPSMAIAATSAGISTMMKNTPTQDGNQGCAFACHQTNPELDNLGNPFENGKMIDNYKLAKNLGVVVRADLVRQAAMSLMDTAEASRANTGAKYRMAVTGFESNFHVFQNLTSDLAAAKVAAGKAKMLPMYKNSQLPIYDAAGNVVGGTYNNDTNTSFTNLINGMAGIIQPPGNGTNAPGDRPQAFLFLVTDGVKDEAVGNNVNNRSIGQIDAQACAQAKALGVRIAIVYTTYLPLPTNGFYNSRVASFQPQIGTNLKNCASPGLFYEVSTDGDISAALNELFATAVNTARIVG